MKIAVCEDEFSDQMKLRSSLSRAKERLSLSFSVEFIKSGKELLDSIASGAEYDLVIFDIYLQAESGLETARRLREKSDAAIAFLTVSEDFALEAYSLDALHYLLKPVTDEGIEELLKRYFRRCGQPLKSLRFRNGRTELEIPLLHIRELKSRSKGVEVVLRRGAGTSWYAVPFREMEWLLGEPGFVRISRGHIVNLEEICVLDGDVCHLRDGSVLSISRRERQNVQKKYSHFLFRKMDAGLSGGSSL